MSIFSHIKGKRPKRNKFDLSHERKLSCNMGDLVPIMCQEVIPGDGFFTDTEIMMRLAPMLAPIMHRVNVYTHYYFVPNRIVWDEWRQFITGGADGLQEPVFPYLNINSDYWDIATSSGSQAGKLSDYFGIPRFDSQPAVDVKINALPFRAYQTIYNEYYRDQNLQDEIEVDKSSGEITDITQAYTIADLQKRCWEKDYLTSCLPFAQRGDAVTVPIQVEYLEEAEIYGDDPDVLVDGATGFTTGTGVDTGKLYYQGANNAGISGKAELRNLADETGVDINDLRRSNKIQEWLELAARGGSRYIEQIQNFFGVKSSDARLQRPEYLGGGKQNVVISEVLQTSETATGTPQGNMAGHGISVGASHGFKKKMFEEHGFVIGIMSVLPRTAYQNGLNRMWSREDKFDFAFPQFAHLGEQEVKNMEAYISDAADQNTIDGVFGYQARYAEYKYQEDMVAGDFRTTLNYWHMGRIFDDTSIPVLNDTFVESDPTHRIFANKEEDDDKLWVQVYNKINALRPLPYFGDPRL